MDPFQFEHGVSSQGISVYWKQIPRVTGWMEMRIGLPVGAYYDPEGKEGCAHFFEHIPFRGTASFPSYEDIQTIDRGLFVDSLNASTGFQRTVFKGRCFLVESSQAIDVMRELLFYPLVRESDFLLEREVVIREFWQEMQTQRDAELRRLEAADLFGNHPCGRMHSPFGWEDTLRNITSADFAQFHDTYYHLGNITLLFVGDVTEQLVMQIADRFARDIARKDAVMSVQRPRVWPPPRTRVRDLSVKQWLKLEHYKNSSVFVRRVMPVQKSGEIFTIFRNLLRSLLETAIRGQLGATYSVRIGRAHAVDHDEISIYIPCAPSVVDRVREIVFNILNSFGKNLAVEEKFKDSKALVVKRAEMVEWGLNRIATDAIDDLLTDGVISSWEETKAARRSVSYEDICRLVREELSEDHLYWRIVRP